MAAINTLRPGETYEVIREFTDYDHQCQAVGETGTFIAKSFVPHEDGGLLEVQQQGQPMHFRMQWRAESQGVVMDNFADYVRPFLRVRPAGGQHRVPNYGERNVRTLRQSALVNPGCRNRLRKEILDFPFRTGFFAGTLLSRSSAGPVLRAERR